MPGEATSVEARFARVDAELQKRWPETRVDPTLRRIADLVDVLGSPHQAVPVIQVAGTNGKTSTARMIDTLLREFGLRTGRFTSPHLQSVTERICIDGEPISKERFVEIYDDVLPFADLVDSRAEEDPPIRLSFFEMMTGMAFAAFVDAPVEVAVIEVGLGGTWDSTNVADAQVAVVTPIGIDHAAILGDTVALIADQKAGIIKSGATAVLATQEPEAAEVLIRRVSEVDAMVAREGAEFGLIDRSVAVGGQQLTLQGLGGVYNDIFLPLHGAHQAQNAVIALAAVEAFFGAGKQGPLDVETVRAGFANVRSPGRLEVVRSAPTVLLDAAHNPHGMTATVAALQEAFDFRRLIGVVAISTDKDAAGMLGLLEPVVDELVVTANSSYRSMDVDTLAAAAVEVFGPDRVTVEPRLDDALETAVNLAEDGETVGGAGVIVTGSVITAGEARTLLAGRR